MIVRYCGHTLKFSLVRGTYNTSFILRISFILRTTLSLFYKHSFYKHIQAEILKYNVVLLLAFISISFPCSGPKKGGVYSY